MASTNLVDNLTQFDKQFFRFASAYCSWHTRIKRLFEFFGIQAIHLRIKDGSSGSSQIVRYFPINRR